MRIAVLFDGAGLARLGLEQAGHTCVGFELDPWKHYLSRFVGSGNCVLADVRDVDLTDFSAVWASPPCQTHSLANPSGITRDHLGLGSYADGTLLAWAEELPNPVLWVENVDCPATRHMPIFNAAQFGPVPLQQRRRRIGGRYRMPTVERPYSPCFKGICPAITATEWAGHANDKRRASRYYGRKLTLDECAYHQGFVIPQEWREPPRNWPLSKAKWRNNLYMAVGNGVPVYMAEAFGRAYPP